MASMALDRTSWAHLGSAAELAGLGLAPGAQPHTRRLYHADGLAAEVGFSADLGWYGLAHPVAGGLQEGRRLIGQHFNLSRPAMVEGGRLALLADLPAALPENLAACIAQFVGDCQLAAGSLEGRSAETTPGGAGDVPAETLGEVASFLDGQAHDWMVRQAAPHEWRLARRSKAPPYYPLAARVSVDAERILFEIVEPSATLRATAPGAARDLLLLRLNGSTKLAAACGSEREVRYKAVLPPAGLHHGLLIAAWQLVLAAHRASHRELQVLGDETLARLYLDMFRMSAST